MPPLGHLAERQSPAHGLLDRRPGPGLGGGGPRGGSRRWGSAECTTTPWASLTGWPRLPTEGTNAERPRAGDVARRDAPTCHLDERLGDVATRAASAGWDACVVVNQESVVL